MWRRMWRRNEVHQQGNIRGEVCVEKKGERVGETMKYCGCRGVENMPICLKHFGIISEWRGFINFALENYPPKQVFGNHQRFFIR